MKPSAERNSLTSPPCARAIERQTARPSPLPSRSEARATAVLDGVGEQVVEHPAHAKRVHVDRRGLDRDGADVAADHHRILNHVVQQHREIEPLTRIVVEASRI